MYRVAIIGGGWSGVAAAVAAKKAGAEVVLIEKTDMLLGLGNVGGIMRNNGRFTAAEENIALGAGELFAVTDKLTRHKNIDFPGHRHGWLYDVVKIEPAIRRLLLSFGIEIRMISRVIDVEYIDIYREEEKEKEIISVELSNGEKVEADVFIECTGSTGPMGNCLTYGNGCCMCILRCPSFGPRVSLTQKLGQSDIMGKRRDEKFGAFSGSGKLEKASLSDEIRKELEEKGVVVVPVPKEEINRDKLNLKVCQQYAMPEYAENIILLDTGYAKIMTPFYPLDRLRAIKGFENAKYVDPYAGGKGNSVRYLSVAERDDFMKIKNTTNMFCGGEKSGLFVGHTEAISTGTLAGYNAVRYLKGMPYLSLPRSLAVGDIISFANERMKEPGGEYSRYTFAGAEYFERMKDKSLYITDVEEIKNKVKGLGLAGIYKEKLL